MKKLKAPKTAILVGVILFTIFSLSSLVGAVTVRPLVIDLQMDQGETAEFELNLTPNDDQGGQKTAALNLYYPRQQLSGGLTYEEADLDQHAVLNWVDLPDQAVIPPDEETTVTGEVSVPFDARGSHTAIVMVEPAVDEAEEGITLQVRYAVRVNVHIDAPGLREDAEVLNFDLTSDDEDRPLLQARLKNPSSLIYSAAGEVTVRDENRRLIERVPIRSQHAAQGGREETTLYPGSEVIFQGTVKEPLPAGEYDLQLFLRYGEGRQIIKRKTVEVGDEFIDPKKLQRVEVSPEVISEQLRRGGAHTEAIEVRNRVGEPLDIRIGAAEIVPDYERSLLKNFQVELRGDQKFQLQGRRSNRSVLIVRAPREIEAGGYYDTLQIGVLDPESGEQLEVREIDLEFLVGEGYEYSAEVQGITGKRAEGEILLSATVANTGDAHLSPTVRVYLRKDGEIQYTQFLELPAEGDLILPEMTGVLTTYTEEIEPGNYTAEVTVQHEGEDISRAEFPLEIPPEG